MVTNWRQEFNNLLFSLVIVEFGLLGDWGLVEDVAKEKTAIGSFPMVSLRTDFDFLPLRPLCTFDSSFLFH